MTQIDHDDQATREARMFQVVFSLATKFGCTVTVHEEEEWFEIDGPEENQVALAIAMADNLVWCEV